MVAEARCAKLCAALCGEGRGGEKRGGGGGARLGEGALAPAAAARVRAPTHDNVLALPPPPQPPHVAHHPEHCKGRSHHRLQPFKRQSGLAYAALTGAPRLHPAVQAARVHGLGAGAHGVLQLPIALQADVAERVSQGRAGGDERGARRRRRARARSSHVVHLQAARAKLERGAQSKRVHSVRGLELEVGTACRGKRQQGRRARRGRRRQAQLHVLPRQAGVGAAQLALARHRRV